MSGARVVGNRYRLLEPVGSGGMGRVWRAWEDDLDRPVAVKEITLPPGITSDTWADVYARTVLEARAAARINHSGVAAVYGMSERDEIPPWIAMEFVPGRSLARMLAEDGPLDLGRAVDVGRQVLAALASGHRVGVLHRDLKPSNVMITPEGRAVLTDFGIARLDGAPRLTVAGAVVGTVGYMAPERFLGQGEGSPAADLWALGATLFAAIRGQGPYDEYTEVTAAIAAITTREPPDIPEAGPLAGLIRSLLSRDPARRPDASWTAQALDAAAVAIDGRPTDNAFAPAEDTNTIRVSRSKPGGARHARRATKRQRRWRRLAVIGTGLATIGAAAGLTAALLANGPANASETFRVTSVLNADTIHHPELFAVTTDGALQHTWTYATDWSKWQPLGSSPVTGVLGVPAVAVDTTKRAELFVRNSAGTIENYYQNKAASGPWLPAPDLTGVTVASDPSVIRQKNGLLAVFARLANGTVEYDVQRTPAPHTSWNGWQPLGGDLASQPVAVVNADGSADVLAVTPGGGLMDDRDLRGWQPVAAGTAFTGTPAVVASPDGRLDVFVRTQGGALDHLWRSGSGQWSAPEPLGSGVRSDPAAVAVMDSRLEVFAQLGDGSIGYAIQQSAANPAAWSALRPVAEQVKVTSPPTAVYDFGRVDVLARTADGGITDFRSTTGTDWSDVTALGGSF